MNPFADIGEFFLDWIREGLLVAWLRFTFEMLFSGVVTFLFVCGGVLASTRSWALSCGLGMTATAISLTVLFRREQSKLTKGMLVVLPAEESTKELETNLQIIQKSK